MQLKIIVNLGKFFGLLFIFTYCQVPDSNRLADEKSRVYLYQVDTISVIESEDALMEVGLRNLATGKKHGLWYYYEGNKLVRIESFQEGVESGPLVEFATGDDGNTSIVAYAYIVKGEFEGPAIRVKADSSLNLYDYWLFRSDHASHFGVTVPLGEIIFQ